MGKRRTPSRTPRSHKGKGTEAELCAGIVCVKTRVDPVTAAVAGVAALFFGLPAAAAMGIGFIAGAVAESDD